MQQHHHASLSLVSKVSMDANQNLSYTLLTKHRFHKTIVLNYTDILNVWCASVKGWAWVKINSKMITIIMYKLQYIHLVLVSLHIISFGLLCVSLSNNQTHTHKQCTKILLSLTLNLSASLQVQFYSHQHAHARTHAHCISHCISESVWVVVSPQACGDNESRRQGLCTHTQKSQDGNTVHAPSHRLYC